MTEDRINKKDSEKQVLIQKVKERLKWYTYEASEEEFDAGEVKALTELLMAMQEEAAGDFDVEDSWSRFPEHCRTREELEQKGIVFADTSAPFTENGERKNAEAAGPDRADTGKRRPEKPAEESTAGDRLRAFGRSHKGAVGIAACIFAAVVLLGGTGVYAEKGGGFFHWLKSDKDSIELITSPEGALNEGMNEAEVYHSVEEVPEEYRGYVWCPEEEMEEWQLQSVNLMKFSSMKKIKSFYTNSENKFVSLELVIYDKNVTRSNLSLKKNELIEEDSNNELDLQVYKRIIEDKVEFVIYYYENNIQYIVNGNIDVEILKEIAKEFFNIL